MNNFKVDITSNALLDEILTIICSGGNNYKKQTKATAYRIDPVLGMIFYWYVDEKYQNPDLSKLPYAFGPNSMSSFALGWMHEMSREVWESYAGKEPDHDGSNERGFRVYNESWERINDEPYSFVAVKPNWAWYGK